MVDKNSVRREMARLMGQKEIYKDVDVQGEVQMSVIRAMRAMPLEKLVELKLFVLGLDEVVD